MKFYLIICLCLVACHGIPQESSEAALFPSNEASNDSPKVHRCNEHCTIALKSKLHSIILVIMCSQINYGVNLGPRKCTPRPTKLYSVQFEFCRHHFNMPRSDPQRAWNPPTEDPSWSPKASSKIALVDRIHNKTSGPDRWWWTAKWWTR